MPETIDVATIAKNAREEIRVTLDHFHGVPCCSIRVWFRADDGSWRPSAKGIAFRAAQLPEITSALIDAEHAARANGMLTAPAGR